MSIKSYKSSLIIIGITVGRWTVISDLVDKICLNDWARAALLRRDGWCWAAHVQAWADSLRLSKAIGGWVIPLFTRRKAANKLSISNDPQITNSFDLTLRTFVQPNVALSCDTRSTLWRQFNFWKIMNLLSYKFESFCCSCNLTLSKL